MTTTTDRPGPGVQPAAPERPGKGTAKVAVLFTAPETVLEDIGRLMTLAEVERALPKDVETLLKINISWQHYYPACSTTPWQLEGVIRALHGAGYGSLIPAQNGTVVVDSHEGEVNNKHAAVLDRYGLPSVHLNDPGVEWVRYEPRGKMLVLDQIFPEGIRIPGLFIGKNIVHLPTVKTHVFTTITGAMKNAFGGLLNFKRHWTHSVIHETLVDLLTIQQEIHPGIFAVTDGTIAGDGPGPRAMRPVVKNVILASADQVAIDATAARLMGFDPLSIPFLRLAHERGLGCADPRHIEVVGEDISGVNWRFTGKEETFASRGQKLIYWGPLKPLENLLLRSPVVPWAYLASNLYFNHYWYRFIGAARAERVLHHTEWGRLFQRY
ncbi:MAG: DUF362 domain-containing protein [Chloroflexi bacterium]|nr:DUF362 domain-containing protein [Chloroflexota bacterium]